jgi:hypothetical protein
MLEKTRKGTPQCLQKEPALPTHCRLLTDKIKKKKTARHQWLMPVILATQEAHSSKPDPISKKPFTKRAGRVAQGVGSEFKPQYHRKKNFMLC